MAKKKIKSVKKESALKFEIPPLQENGLPGPIALPPSALEPSRGSCNDVQAYKLSKQERRKAKKALKKDHRILDNITDTLEDRMLQMRFPIWVKQILEGRPISWSEWSLYTNHLPDKEALAVYHRIQEAFFYFNKPSWMPKWLFKFGISIRRAWENTFIIMEVDNIFSDASIDRLEDKIKRDADALKELKHKKK